MSYLDKLTFTTLQFNTVCLSVCLSTQITGQCRLTVRSDHPSEPDAPPQFLKNIPGFPRRHGGWAAVNTVMNLMFLTRQGIP